MEASEAQKRAEMPGGTSSILNRRTLDKGFAVLKDLLQPGHSVLDFGCGSGALTIDMAERVFPGQVHGIDINEPLLAEARLASQLRNISNIEFVSDDVYQPTITNKADFVVSARLLQWLEFPQKAIHAMVARTKPGGSLVILDYNHTKVKWEPEPPTSFKEFYAAFLQWRSSAGMDNEIADHLEGHLTGAGLKEVRLVPQLEVAGYGSENFYDQLRLWRDVARSRGLQIVRDGFITEAKRRKAQDDYQDWMQTKARRQTLYLMAAIGNREPV